MQRFGQRLLAAVVSSRGLLILSVGSFLLGLSLVFAGAADMQALGLLESSVTVPRELVPPSLTWGFVLLWLSPGLLLASLVRSLLLLVRLLRPRRLTTA